MCGAVRLRARCNGWGWDAVQVGASTVPRRCGAQAVRGWGGGRGVLKTKAGDTQNGLPRRGGAVGHWVRGWAGAGAPAGWSGGEGGRQGEGSRTGELLGSPASGRPRTVGKQRPGAQGSGFMLCCLLFLGAGARRLGRAGRNPRSSKFGGEARRGEVRWQGSVVGGWGGVSGGMRWREGVGAAKG